jgi:hypothetical protein
MGELDRLFQAAQKIGPIPGKPGIETCGCEFIEGEVFFSAAEEAATAFEWIG